MTLIAASVFGEAGRQLGGFIPRLGGALALLLVGIIVVSLLTRALTKALRAAGVDELATRSGITRVLQQGGLGDSFAVVIGRAIRIALFIVVVFAAVSLLGLQFLSASLNKGVQDLPKLLIAAALVLAGLVLGGLARERADRLSTQLELPIPLGPFAQITVLAIFGIVAAAQIAVSTLVLLLLIGILLGGVTGTFALAFGLGGRDVAQALTAGRYLRQSYEIGQRISVGELYGRITAIDPSTTTLDVGNSSLVRIPNQLLIQSIVTIYPEPPGEEATGTARTPPDPPST